jgi:hypothetical protein
LISGAHLLALKGLPSDNFHALRSLGPMFSDDLRCWLAEDFPDIKKGALSGIAVLQPDALVTEFSNQRARSKGDANLTFRPVPGLLFQVFRS